MILIDKNFLLKGGREMKKVFFPALIVLFLFSAGCASRDYVRQQIEPLVERISKIEAKVSSMGPCQAEEARKDAADAKSLAQEALKTAQDCCGKADAAAKRAEDAANRAEDAAKKAAAAAEKSKKAFELQQTK
jgi:ElaB/YqjD/DUF883 family membrane-anchored ribosome-binding protein